MKMLSVVIPVYNVGKFLPGLFDKLSDFPHENVDIILVNDGSTDNSKSLCEEIVADKSNFILIYQANSGVSRTRNVGIAQANSEYIWFCDADDEFTAGVIFDLLERTLKEQVPAPDVLSFSYEIYFTDSNKIYSYSFDDMTCSGKEVIARFNNYEKKNNLSTVWNKIFKTSLIKNNNISFDEEMHHSEDRVFNIHALEKASKVLFSKDMGYRYIRYASGTLATRFDSGRAICTRKADEIMIDYLISQNIDVSHTRDRMLLNFISLSCENAVRGDISLMKGYSAFRQDFSTARTEKPIEADEGSRVSRLSRYFINHNYPFLFYCLFYFKIKVRGILNKFR